MCDINLDMNKGNNISIIIQLTVMLTFSLGCGTITIVIVRIGYKMNLKDIKKAIKPQNAA